MHAPLKSHSNQRATRDVLPEALVSRDSLDDLRAQLAQRSIPNEGSEPDWGKLRASLKRQHSLNPHRADEMMRTLERLWLLPFERYDDCAAHIIFFFTALPKIEKRFREEDDQDGLTLVRAFKVIIELLLEGRTLFPGRPHNIAQYLQKCLEFPTPESRIRILPIARMLARASAGVCGNNSYVARAPNTIAIHEHFLNVEQFRTALADSYKLDSYIAKLTADEAFWQEWGELKRDFSGYNFWGDGGVVRPHEFSARYWSVTGQYHLKRIEHRFAVTFTIFCWKWFLAGMRRGDPRDQPLVRGVEYALGPYGTSIFIPAYWSVDLNRDILWREIICVHRARGVSRQGKKLERNREQLLEQTRQAQEADREAKRQGLSGEKRYNFIKQRAGLDLRTDNAQVRKLVRGVISASPVH